MILFPKPGTYRSPGYLAFVRQRPCSVPGCCNPSTAHHSETGGLQVKCSDTRSIPLCWAHHEELHRIGRVRFQERYNIDFTSVLICVLELYVIHLETGGG